MSACPIADEAVNEHAQRDRRRRGRALLAFVIILTFGLAAFGILQRSIDANHQTNMRLEHDYTALCKSVRRSADVQVSVLRNGLAAAEKANDAVKIDRLNADLAIASKPVPCEKEAP